LHPETVLTRSSLRQRTKNIESIPIIGSAYKLPYSL
jgi:hypothetical protein